MSNQAFVNFKNLYDSGKLSPELMKELKTVEETLNLTPTVKDPKTKNWVASPTNVAVMSYIDVTARKISSMVAQGLSYASGDYYIFVQFGGKPSVTKSPNGIIKAMNKLASKHGYIANINTGCVFKNYEQFSVKRNGLIDTIELVNSAEHEIGVGVNEDILSPYAVVTLYDKKTSKIVSSKVTIIRSGEYQVAKKQGSYTHKTYPVPMAEKIALKRAGEQMAASLGIDDSVELEALKREIDDHNAEYDLEKPVENEKPKAELIGQDEINWINRAIEESNTDENAFNAWLKRNRCNSIEEITTAFYPDVKRNLDNALSKAGA